MNRNAEYNPHPGKQGAALLVALWVLIILSLIVGSFAFEMDLEARLVSHKRKQFQAERLARSGVEYAQAILSESYQVKQLELESQPDDETGFLQAALYASRGLPTTSEIAMGDGTFRVTLEAGGGARNVNLLTRAEWIDIFEMANIPATEWDTMIDCLLDWIDAGDFQRLNGAESDDPFYQERGYPVKNGLLDSVEELLLIKGWGEDVLYGTDADEEGEPIFGIAELLTVWGNGKVNLNTAGTDVLLSFAEYEDWELAGVEEARLGEDGEEGTLDDGIKSLEQVGADPGKFNLQSEFVKVTSVGELFGTRYKIECILLPNGRTPRIVYWKEGPVSR